MTPESLGQTSQGTRSVYAYWHENAAKNQCFFIIFTATIKNLDCTHTGIYLKSLTEDVHFFQLSEKIFIKIKKDKKKPPHTGCNLRQSVSYVLTFTFVLTYICPTNPESRLFFCWRGVFFFLVVHTWDCFFSKKQKCECVTFFPIQTLALLYSMSFPSFLRLTVDLYNLPNSTQLKFESLYSWHGPFFLNLVPLKDFQPF